jgi:putative DNA primase/helicase
MAETIPQAIVATAEFFGGRREVRVLGGGPPISIICDGSEDLAATAARFHGKRDVYLGQNQTTLPPGEREPVWDEAKQKWRRPAVSAEEIIDLIEFASWDVDPIKDKDTKQPLEGEREAAREEARRLLEHLRSLGFWIPAWADSGGGWWLPMPVAMPKTDETSTLRNDLFWAFHNNGYPRLDTSTSDAPRVIRFFGTDNMKYEAGPLPTRMYRLDEDPANWDGRRWIGPRVSEEMIREAIASFPTSSTGNGSGSHKPRQPLTLGTDISPGEAHKVTLANIGTLVASGKPRKEITDLAIKMNAGRTPEDELLKMIDHCWDNEYPKGETQPDNEDEQHLTELGNAKRLVARYKDEIRFCPTLGRSGMWLVWDGKRWKPDISGAVIRRAKEIVRAMFREAAGMEGDERNKLWAHANRSEAAIKLRHMVELATTETEVVVEGQDLDSDPNLLTVLNGTLNLATGELQDHRPEDMITKLAPVTYDPDARSELWDSFLARVVPDVETRRFLARAAGYSLSGDAGEEVLLFLFGATNSGKSSFLEGFKTMLGDYSATVDFASLLKSRPREGQAASADIARLAGIRFAASVEVGDGAELATGIVKWLTGQDTIVTRFLYGTLFEFLPQFTLWLAANERPEAKDDDEALWRRIHTVPFDETIPEAERKKEVKKQLRSDATVRSAMLNWALQGRADYLENGLAPPSLVRKATKAYRDAMDPLGDFLEECTEANESWSTPFAELWDVYQGWAKKNILANKTLTQMQFARRLDPKYPSDKERHPSRRGIMITDEGRRNYASEAW